MQKSELITIKILSELGFEREVPSIEESWTRADIEAKRLILRRFDGAYYFVPFESQTGFGRMLTTKELINGLEFILR